MVPAGFLVAVALQIGRLQAELRGDVLHHDGRHLGQVGQERAEEPHRAHLDRPAELATGAVAGHRLAAGADAEVEEPAQPSLIRIGVEPAVAGTLILGEEPDRHAATSTSTR